MAGNEIPVRHGLGLAYLSSLTVAGLVAMVSATGLLGWSSLYPSDLAASTVGSDAFNLAIIVPILLASLWLARRGSLIGLLLWPGTLFYLLYIFAFYLLQLPAGVLFLPYVLVIVLSSYTLIALAASIDGQIVRDSLSAGRAPARAAGLVLAGLALLFIAIDLAAVMAGTPLDATKHAAYVVDLTIECPALLLGGMLLWRRSALGYVAGTGLLFQISALLAGVPAGAALGAMLTGSPVDMSGIVLLAIGAVPVALLALSGMAATKTTRGHSS